MESGACARLIFLEIRGQLPGLSSFLPPHEPQGPNPGRQSLYQMSHLLALWKALLIVTSGSRQFI